jgi:tRNA (mo5U34)-methyltransferase
MDLMEHVMRMNWYHTIELAPGVVTPGLVDTRRYVAQYGLPESMSGMRALDIGTQDGFWAFEMESRGAQVLAINHPLRNMDHPLRWRHLNSARGLSPCFHVAKEILGSNVEYVGLDVCQLQAEDVGTFDLVFAGSVLIHVRDQCLALERVAAVCRGMFISAEPYDRMSGLVPFPVSRYEASRINEAGGNQWIYHWKPSARAWKQMIWGAGFDKVRQHGRFVAKTDWGFKDPHVVHHANASMTV